MKMLNAECRMPSNPCSVINNGCWTLGLQRWAFPVNSVFRFSFFVLFMCLLLAGCASPPPPPPDVDPDLSRVTKTARVAFQDGQIQQAARLYIRGLRMARAVDNTREIGTIAYNLAACLMQLGEYDDANRYLTEALREFERAGRSPMDILLLQAEVARAQAQSKQALALLDKAVALPEGSINAYRVQIALLKADLACDQGHVETAVSELNSVEKILQKITDPMVKGNAEGIRARIALLENKPADAGGAYDRQAADYQQAEKFSAMARAIGRAGETYMAAGNYPFAADRFYRAGRSLYAQGNELDALKMVKGALDAIEKSGEKDVLDHTVMLFNEIKENIEQQKSNAEPRTLKSKPETMNP